MNFFQFLLKIKKLNGISESVKLLKNLSIYIEWSNQIKSKKYPIQLELPWLTIDAKNYIVRYLKGKKNLKVFEYGSGGSSLFFTKYSAEVVSIEHDSNWFYEVESLIKKRNIKNWKGFLIEPEIMADGWVKEPSYPNSYFSDDENFKDSTFIKYAQSIEQFGDENFDLVLIDGRCRPSCIAHSFKKVKKGGLLIIDNSEREYYYKETINYLKNYSLELKSNSALICTPQFTQTNIFKRLE